MIPIIKGWAPTLVLKQRRGAAEKAYYIYGMVVFQSRISN